MSAARAELLELLKRRSLTFGDFKLASGDRSTYYIDGRMSTVCARGSRLIGEVLFDYTKDLNINAIGGLEVGAVPLATAAVIAYDLHGRDMEGFWVRDAAKKHGMKKLVEGNLQPGGRVVILDDVITRGESALKALEAVKAMGCEVVMVLALVDRLAGAAQLFESQGVKNFQAVFTIRDLGVS